VCPPDHGGAAILEWRARVGAAVGAAVGVGVGIGVGSAAVPASVRQRRLAKRAAGLCYLVLADSVSDM
jgi:F0F1-type ATP synthase membrane subunit c/vacuolar-type H+-ATPase subunit K